MKITFIGSSHGVPEAHRKCTCIMIEIDKNIYFVDMGTSAIDALRTRGISVDAVKGIFITHMHGDHTNGLIQFVDLITWYFKTPDPVICLPVMEAAKVIDDWLQVTLNESKKEINYHETQTGVIFNDGVLKVTAFATQHCHKSYSYLLEAEGKTILCTGDLKSPGIDFPALSSEQTLDLVVCESAHFPTTEYIPVFEKYDIKKVCVTHYLNTFLADILELQKVMSQNNLPVVTATDDFELTI